MSVPSRQLPWPGVAAVVGLLLVASACSSDSSADTTGVASLEAASESSADSTEDAADGDTEVDVEQAALDFSQCMRDQGLDFPDIGIDAEGNPDLRSGFESVVGQEGFRDANEACRSHLEGAGFGGGRAALAENVEVQDALVEFSACVRDQGFDVGDVQLGGPGGPGGPGGGGADGPADDGDPDANEQGGRRGDGFGRSRRLADGLGLDPEDPEVEDAIADCEPILDEALSAAGLGRP